MNVIVVGSTGLVASNFIEALIKSDKVQKIWAFSRSEPPAHWSQSPKFVKVVSKDTSSWHTHFPENADVMMSGIATTKRAAGGIKQQRLIDHDMQVDLASEARDKNCRAFILISAGQANKSSMFDYLKLKGDTEEAIEALNFEKTIILRPGFLIGERLGPKVGFGMGTMNVVMPKLYRSPFQSLVGYPVLASEVVKVALKSVESLPNGIHIIESKEILDQTEAQ